MRDEDVAKLCTTFPDLDIDVIKDIYDMNNGDMELTAKQLWSLMKSQAPGANVTSRDGGSIWARGPESYGHRHDEALGWDSGLQVLTETLNTIGTTVTEGINALAVGVSSLLGELSSAFDASWQDEDARPERPSGSHPSIDNAVVTHKGEAHEGALHRRQLHTSTSSGSTAAAAAAAAADEGEEQGVQDGSLGGGWDDDEYYEKKDK